MGAAPRMVGGARLVSHCDLCCAAAKVGAALVREEESMCYRSATRRLLVLCLGLWHATFAADLTRADADIWLDGFMPYAINSGDISGAAVVIVKDGKVITERGY